MKEPAIKSVRHAFESDNVVITNIFQGYNNQVRIDAKTRRYIADKDNFFSKWVSYEHANKLALENYGKELSEMNAFNF